MVAKVESTIRPFYTEKANSVGRTINNLLQKAQPAKANKTKDMKQALKSWKEDDTIIVLPADKGRASAVSRYRDISPEDENSCRERSISTS